MRPAEGDSGSMGLYAKVTPTEAWQTFTLPFKAKASAEQAALGFELGGSDAAVEIADVGIKEAAKQGWCRSGGLRRLR